MWAVPDREPRKAAVLLALSTGMRCPELLRLRWSSVKWEKRTVTVEPRTAKVKTSRVLPLNAEALDVLKAWT